ncbi:MAG TPA: SEC-C metal-binding domain-containing protein [Elusimicrobiota bacterium]|nr:SEC-C metal-binding domain-containing protein [Elusimicrobiota bacterium]
MDIGRNDPCHCGSGKKYKKCCQAKDQTKAHTELEERWDQAVKTLEKEKTDESKSEPKTGGPAVQRKANTAQPHVQKHNTIAAPKFNMPRKAGGG